MIWILLAASAAIGFVYVKKRRQRKASTAGLEPDCVTDRYPA